MQLYTKPVRLNIIYLLIFIIPGLVLVYLTSGEIIDLLRPIIKLSGNSYRVCAPTGCMSIQKEILDEAGDSIFNTQSQYSTTELFNLNNGSFKEQQLTKFIYYYNSAKNEKKSNIFSAGLDTFGSLLFIIPAIVMWRKNRIYIKDNNLIIQTIVLAYKNRLSSNSPVRFKSPQSLKEGFTTKKAIIPLDRIKTLDFITKTPLGNTKEKIEELNWRDTVNIQYLDDNGEATDAYVDLFYFPKFKQIVLYLKSNYPLISTSFRKMSLSEDINPYVK